MPKPVWNLSRVLSDPCSDRYSKLAKICISALEVQRSMSRVTELLANTLQFHPDLSAPIEAKKDQARWQVVLNELNQLKAVAQTVATSPAR